jgi:hypothetical protein
MLLNSAEKDGAGNKGEGYAWDARLPRSFEITAERLERASGKSTGLKPALGVDENEDVAPSV